MKSIRKYLSISLLILFSCYFISINFFGHTHVINGVSKVHSHLGGDSSHTHNSAEIIVIDLLSQFESESISGFHHLDTPLFFTSEFIKKYEEPALLDFPNGTSPLRGPPQCLISIV